MMMTGRRRFIYSLSLRERCWWSLFSARLPQQPELFRGHHPAEKAWTARWQAGDLDRADRAPFEVKVEITTAGEERRANFGKVGHVADDQGPVELPRAELDEDVGERSLAITEGAARSERVDYFYPVEKIEAGGDQLGGLPATPEGAGQNHVEPESELPQAQGLQLESGPALIAQWPVGVTAGAGFARIQGDPVPHQV